MIYFVRPHLRAYTFYEPRSDFVSNLSRFRSWVLVAIESGHFRFQTDHASGEAGFGDLVFAAPNGRFERFAMEPISYHVLQFEIEENSGVALSDGLFSIRETARLRDDFAYLRRYTTSCDERVHSRLENLLGDLLHLVWESRFELPTAPDPLMLEAARRLEANAGTAFSMRVISDGFGMGSVAFTRRFRACHGCNPIEFLTDRRLEIARRLLLETSMSLDEIAVQCGYASGFYLSNVWKKNTGIAPGTFRKRHRV